MADAITSQAATLEAVSIPSPVSVFQGYDSVTGGGLSTAVTGTITKVGGTSSADYSVCTDLEQLSRSLQIDQSLSVGFGPFGSFDEKMQFVYKLDVTTYSVSIVVYSRHFGYKETTDDVRLKSGIKPPQGNPELRDFFRGYGDSFLASRTTGGEYYAVYTYYSQTREEQTQLTIDMKAHGIFNGGKVDAGLQAKISSFQSSTKTRSTFNQNVSGLRNPKLPDSDHVVEYAIAFTSIPLDNPAIIGFDTTGYEHVPGFGDFQPIASNRDFFVGNTVMGGLTKPLVQIQEVETQIAWIRGVYRFYGGYNDPQLTQNGIQSKTDHTTLDKLFQQFEADPTATFTQPALPSLKNGTPSLNYRISDSPSFGGPGGDPFDDIDAVGFTSFVPEQTRLSVLQLRSGARIDQLLTTYQNNSGQTWTFGHGGGGGSLGNKLNLMSGEFVTKVTGRSGARVDHLTITITNGGKVDGGGTGGNFFDWSVPTNSFVLGFKGRSARELDQITFIYAQFGAAKWTPIT